MLQVPVLAVGGAAESRMQQSIYLLCAQKHPSPSTASDVPVYPLLQAPVLPEYLPAASLSNKCL